MIPENYALERVDVSALSTSSKDPSPIMSANSFRPQPTRNSISGAYDYEGNQAFLRSLTDGLTPDPPMTARRFVSGAMRFAWPNCSGQRTRTGALASVLMPPFSRLVAA